VSSARGSGFGKGREAGRAASTPFIEKLRRDLGSSGKPERSLFSLRCEQGHALLWLLASPDGVVPVAAVWAAATATLGFCLRSHPDGAPFTLASWPADERLPVGSCPWCRRLGHRGSCGRAALACRGNANARAQGAVAVVR